VARAVTTALAKSPADRFPTAAAFDAALAGTAEATAPRRRWTLPAAIGVGALALAVAGYAVATRRSASDKSIAVLPLVNQSRVEEDQIRSDGMTEALIDALSQVQGLRVPSRTEVYATSTAGLDSREIGARLHVATLLEGSYEPVGDLLQVTVRLVNAGDGSVVWSNMFRRNRRDVFAVQDEISQAVTNALRVRLGGGPRTPPRATASLEAYDLYLKGRWYWNQRGIGSAPMRRAIDYFNQAIALDSNYAQAWAGLADVYSLLPAFGDAPPADAFAAAKRAALRALALDSNLAEAHTSLGIISVFHDWEWTTAAREFDRALALDSMEPRQHLFHAWYYVSQGRLDDALREVQTAQRLNPVSPIVNARVGDVLMYMGRLDEAAAELRQAIALDSSNVTARAVLGRALTQSGRFDEAIATFPPQLDIEAGRFGGIKAYALGRAGRQAEARAVTRRLSQIARQRYIDPIAFAYAAIGVGDTASALTSIEQALREHSFFMLFLAVDPPFASLHANPRYLAIVREVGLTFPPHPAR
jgi:TolB-like protein/Tfp pilus assembly protein PilF